MTSRTFTELIAMKTGTFEYKGKTYTWTARNVETDYGPKKLVIILDKDDVVATYQECASPLTIVNWFQQAMDEEEVMTAREAEQDVQPCNCTERTICEECRNETYFRR